jgi:hypothetical protein
MLYLLTKVEPSAVMPFPHAAQCNAMSPQLEANPLARVQICTNLTIRAPLRQSARLIPAFAAEPPF